MTSDKHVIPADTCLLYIYKRAIPLLNPDQLSRHRVTKIHRSIVQGTTGSPSSNKLISQIGNNKNILGMDALFQR